jgi:hypothetical protein
MTGHLDVLAILLVSIALAWTCRPATAAGRAAKWIILGTGVALAGSIYRPIVQLGAVVALPAGVVLLAVAWREREPAATVNFGLAAAVAASGCLILVT